MRHAAPIRDSGRLRPVLVPLAAEAQQAAMPVIGFLSTRSPGEAAYVTAAFRQGLKEIGIVEGENVAFDFRGRTFNTIDCWRWRPI